MNLFLVSLLVAAFPPWLSAVVTEDGDEGKAKVRVMFMSKDGATAGGECCLGDGNVKIVMKTLGDVGAVAKAGVFMVAVGGDDKDGRSETHKIRILRSGAGKEKGYLGVTIAGGSDEEGVTIRSIIKDSAAERAGLEANDVVISIDGEAIEGEVSRMTALIGAKKPGDEIEIVILRDGQELEATAVLGENANTFNFKFGDGEELNVFDQIQTRGRMLSRDDDGNWVFQDLGELEGLTDLPANIRMFLPKAGTRTMQFFGGESDKKMQIKVEKDGTMLMLSKDGDGEITVTRRDEDGEETVETYADSAALEAADEEAFDLFGTSGAGNVFKFDIDGLHEGLEGLKFDFDFDFDTDALHEGVFEWREHLEESLKGLGEAHELATEELHELMEKLKSGDGTAMGLHFKALPGALRSLEGMKDGFPHRLLMRAGKPKHTFEVQTDGTIEVRIRKGDSELVQLFEHEADLERQKPELYAKFRKLMDTDDE